MMGILNTILNNALYVSILFILLSSLVAFYARARTRDRCLRDFDGFLVTIEDKAGEVAWGKMRVYSSGIELLYAATHRDAEGHDENSYILYGAELAKLRALYRFHDDQTSEDQDRRQHEIECTYRPSLYRQGTRILRNLISTFKDAIVQTTNTVLAYRAQQNPQSQVLARHKDLTTTGEQLWVSTVGNAYEPILEHYVGRFVVLELSGKEIEEENGILKEYSAAYIELLNVKLEVPLPIYVKSRRGTGRPLTQVVFHKDHVSISNDLERTLVVAGIRCGEAVRPVDTAVEPGQSVDIPLGADEMGQKVDVELTVRCMADLIVPRTRAVVRHAGRHDKLSLEALLGLDDLSRAPWVKKLKDSSLSRQLSSMLREPSGAMVRESDLDSADKR